MARTDAVPIPQLGKLRPGAIPPFQAHTQVPYGVGAGAGPPSPAACSSRPPAGASSNGAAASKTLVKRSCFRPRVFTVSESGRAALANPQGGLQVADFSQAPHVGEGEGAPFTSPFCAPGPQSSARRHESPPEVAPTPDSITAGRGLPQTHRGLGDGAGLLPLTCPGQGLGTGWEERALCLAWTHHGPAGSLSHQ